MAVESLSLDPISGQGERVSSRQQPQPSPPLLLSGDFLVLLHRGKSTEIMVEVKSYLSDNESLFIAKISRDTSAATRRLSGARR